MSSSSGIGLPSAVKYTSEVEDLFDWNKRGNEERRNFLGWRDSGEEVEVLGRSREVGVRFCR